MNDTSAWLTLTTSSRGCSIAEALTEGRTPTMTTKEIREEINQYADRGYPEHKRGIPVLQVRVVDGADNAQEIDRFIFRPDQLDQDEMDVETVLHHGERVTVDEPQRRNRLIFC